MAVALIEPCAVNADGVITVTTANGRSLKGRCESIRIRHRLNTDMIMSVDDTLENHVALYEGYVVELREIQTVKTATVAGGYENVLPSMYYQADYFRVTLSKGGKTYVVYGIRSDMDDGIEGQGRQTTSLTLLPVNVNVDASSTASVAYGDAS